MRARVILLVGTAGKKKKKKLPAALLWLLFDIEKSQAADSLEKRKKKLREVRINIERSSRSG